MTLFEQPGANADASDSDRCVVCGAHLPPEVNVKVRLLDRHYLQACSECGTWLYLPRHKPAEQVSIHDDELYFDHPYFKLRRNANEGQRRRCRGIFARINMGIDCSSLRGQRLLDIGCDTGVFLQIAAEEFGIVPVGIDVSKRAVSSARECGIEAYRFTIEEAPENLRDFAVITAIDLIEHVTDPISFLTEIRRRLRPGGVVYVETPNIRSAVYDAGRLLSLVSRGRAAALLDRLFPPQHIQYFTRTSLAQMAGISGLEVVHLDTRVLPSTDVAASLPIRASVAALQLVDRLAGNRILICALLRRSVSGT